MLRPLGGFDEQARPLAGTDGAYWPFFSPDGQWIAYMSEKPDPFTIQKVRVDGGAPVTICERPSNGSGAWGDDGMIYFGSERGGI